MEVKVARAFVLDDASMRSASNDQIVSATKDCVAQALLPVPKRPSGGSKHRQECRCHTSMVIPAFNLPQQVSRFRMIGKNFT